MWKLPDIFSSGAMFQFNSELTLKGKTNKSSPVEGKIINSSGETVSSGKAVSDGEGVFAVTLHTPAPSFEKYSIELSNGKDNFLMEDVLFGELWLATGQSNMEMGNWTMPENQDLYDAVAEKTIRTYNVDYYPDTENFPREPDNSVPGSWANSLDTSKLKMVSAVALRFCNDIYPFLNKEKPVPVGFLNASWGGTGINGWLPLSEIDKDEYIKSRMEKIKAYPCEENWNKCDEALRFQQPTAMYNVKIAPLEGVKVRGILWYQGENDCPADSVYHIYEDYMRFYHRIYRERFAADRDDFKMLCVMLYPWIYSELSDCFRGNLNNAFLKNSVEEPDKFACIPISDLTPRWAFNYRYHPIHPSNKYEVGSRLARLAIGAVYDGARQKTPAVLSSFQNLGDRFLLHFNSVGSGLYIKGIHAKGLYASDEKGRFLPADATVISPDTLEVKCRNVKSIKSVAYDIQSMDTLCNIFAGDFPIMPFFTGDEWPKCIESRPWYHTSATSVWVAGFINENCQDVFFRPVFEPLPGSMICTDTAFHQKDEDASLRIIGEKENQFGCFVRSYPYNNLDFQNYDGLTADFYNTEGMTAELVLSTEDGEQVFKFEKTADLGDGRFRYEVKFNELSQKKINRMSFRFTVDEKNPYKFVNMEKVRLF